MNCPSSHKLRPDPTVFAAVLVGGLSKRMGRDKALIPLCGKPLIEYVLENLKGIFSKIVLIGQTREGLEKYGEIFPDLALSLGPVSGIHAALKVLNRPVFVCGCDMPFLNQGLIRYQVEVRDGFDAVVPKPGDFFEPLHAVYAPACRPALEGLIGAGRKRPVEMFAQLRVREIGAEEIQSRDPALRSFFNINTVEDLRKAEELIRNQRRDQAGV